MPPLELLVGGAYLLFWLGLVAVHEYGSRRVLWRSALWRDTAHEVGLTTMVELGVSTVAAYRGRLRVRFADLPKQEGYGTRLEIEGPGLAPGLTLGPEPRAALVASRSPREIELGDDDFDREVALQGPPAVALAVLDSPTHRQRRDDCLRGRATPGACACGPDVRGQAALGTVIARRRVTGLDATANHRRSIG